MTIQKTGSTSRRLRHPAGILRPSFTLIELLVVISIISVLMLLTVRVIGAFISQAKASATETTIRKIQGLLSQRADALYRLEQRTGFLANTPEYLQAYTIVLGLNSGNANVNLQKVLAVKLLTRKYFPQSSGEIPNDSVLFQQIAGQGVSNGEILYHFLTQSGVIGDRPIGTDAFSIAEVGDPDGDGFPEFIDAWGNPLRFYRWPTRLFRPTGIPTVVNPTTGIDSTNAQVLLSTLPSFSGNLTVDLARDPDDPLRLCLNLPVPANQFEQYGGLHLNTPATYHVMLVVSAGPDGVLGLYEPDDFANNGHLGAVNLSEVNSLYDDVTYLNTRAGGR
jgi:prepilin-type N-terminal cleavage/methylation domain-containing protein